ncbi:hypothetical protein, partial [Pseudomonas sp. GW531-E2]|uniref:hypothetical protein n=1 Tax=Pseudomonas sp. GW531-E2 TaxID=2070679 RepID=UPI001C45DFA9
LLSSCYEVNHPLVHRALWSEFIPLATVEKELPQLQKLQLSVFIAIHEENPDYDGFAHLYKEAAKLQVEVRPWLLLREANGYWFNKWNAQA